MLCGLGGGRCYSLLCGLCRRQCSVLCGLSGRQCSILCGLGGRRYSILCGLCSRQCSVLCSLYSGKPHDPVWLRHSFSERRTALGNAITSFRTKKSSTKNNSLPGIQPDGQSRSRLEFVPGSYSGSLVQRHSKHAPAL